MSHDPSVRPMDLLIFGLGRAGTTLLANLLTTPPGRWVIVEPGITRGGVDENVRQQALRFGLEIGEKPWGSAAHGEGGAGGAAEPSEARFERVLRAHVDGLERWGVKEVNPAGIDRLLALYRPRRVVLAVRDIRDAALSALEKVNKGATPTHDERWLRDRLLGGAQTLVRLRRELPEGRTRVARYEDLVAGAGERRALADWLGWPLDGDPSRCLDLYGRSEEAARHGGRVTAVSIGRREGEARAERRSFADALAKEGAAFQSAFGYADEAALAP